MKTFRTKAITSAIVSTAIAASMIAVPQVASALPAAETDNPKLTEYRDGLPEIEGPEGELYVPNPGEENIRVYDTKTSELKKKIPLENGAQKPGVIAQTPDHKKLYVDNFGINPATVTVIDRSKNDATKTIPVFSTPLGIFTSLDGKEIYVPEMGGMVEVIDVETDKVVRQLKFPDVPVASIAGPDGLMYVGFGSGYISAVDPKTGEVVKEPLHVGGIGAFWYTFTHDKKKLFVDVVNSIAVVDLEKWEVVDRIHTSKDGNYHLHNAGAFVSTLHPTEDKLYATMFGRPNVLVIDTNTNKVIKEIPTSGFQTAVEFTPDGSRAYISDMGPKSLPWEGPIGDIALFGKTIWVGNTGPSQMTVLDPKTDNVIGTISNGNHGAGVPAVVPPKSELETNN